MSEERAEGIIGTFGRLREGIRSVGVSKKCPSSTLSSDTRCGAAMWSASLNSRESAPFQEQMENHFRAETKFRAVLNYSPTFRFTKFSLFHKRFFFSIQFVYFTLPGAVGSEIKALAS